MSDITITQEMSLEDPEDVRRIIFLNPRLKNTFLKELLHHPLKKSVIVDEDLYPHAMIVSLADYDGIMARFDETYFKRVSAKRTDAIISEKMYREYYRGKNQHQLCVGDLVTLVLDGNAYVIVDLNKNTGTYTIVESQKGVTRIKVPGDVLKKR